MSILSWIYGSTRDFLGYGEAHVAARKAAIEADKLEDERLKKELYQRYMLYEITNNDTGIIKLLNRLRYHPNMRHAYLEPTIISILLFLMELADLGQFISALTKLR
jgi:hypothetical protein